MKNYRIITILLLFLIGCTSKKDDVKIVKPILDCIHEDDSSIFPTLDRFEEYLIKENFIKSTSRKHYLEFLDSLLYKNLDHSDMGQYIFNGNDESYSYFTPGRTAIIIECINNSELSNTNRKLYKLSGKVLLNEITKYSQQISNDHELGMDFSSSIIKYKDIPKEYFGNPLIHYCLLWNIYPYR